MKEFLNLLGWKELIVVLFAMIMIRINIIIPFYAQWNLPATISWENFLIFAFGICFLLAGNNVAIKFYDEKQKVISQNKERIFNIKDYPDIIRFRGAWTVFWFVGIIATCYSFWKTNYNYYYISLMVLTLLIGYTYASRTRRILLIGNLSLATFYSAIILSQMPHDASVLVPYTYRFPNPMAIGYNDVFSLFVFFAILVFVLTILRDITGDVTNIKDDRQKEYTTIGVKLGENKSKIVLYLISAIFILLICLFLYCYKNLLGSFYIIITAAIVILPIVYYMIMLQKARKQTDFNYLYVFLSMIFISILFVISFCKNFFINGNIQ